jgi:hypothetical protein
MPGEEAEEQRDAETLRGGVYLDTAETAGSRITLPGSQCPPLAVPGVPDVARVESANPWAADVEFRIECGLGGPNA